MWCGLAGARGVQVTSPVLIDGEADRQTRFAVEDVDTRLTVVNFTDIAAIYGEAVAKGALSIVAKRIEHFIGSRHAQVVVGPDPAVIIVRRQKGSIAEFSQLLSVAVRSTVMSPISHSDVEVVFGIVIGDLPRETPIAMSAQAGFRSANYRSDMAAVVAAFSAISSGRLYFAEQAVAASDGSSKELYRECLVRVGGEAGQAIMPGAFLPAVERLGLTQAFDALVVDMTIGALQRRPDAVLGCNISGRSVEFDDWWEEAIAQLSELPCLATRLVIEITETADLPDIASAKRLVEALQLCGCRIALDDFGTGYNTIDRARELQPDIIKIDRSYIKESRDDVAPYALLRHLVGLADAIAPIVVVEGIESQSDLVRALTAGVSWVQGFHIDGWNDGGMNGRRSHPMVETRGVA